MGVDLLVETYKDALDENKKSELDRSQMMKSTPLEELAVKIDDVEMNNLNKDDQS